MCCVVNTEEAHSKIKSYGPFRAKNIFIRKAEDMSYLDFSNKPHQLPYKIWQKKPEENTVNWQIEQCNRLKD